MDSGAPWVEFSARLSSLSMSGTSSARGLPATLTTRSVVASRSPVWAGSIRSTLSARSRPN